MFEIEISKWTFSVSGDKVLFRTHFSLDENLSYRDIFFVPESKTCPIRSLSLETYLITPSEEGSLDQPAPVGDK